MPTAHFSLQIQTFNTIAMMFFRVRITRTQWKRNYCLWFACSQYAMWPYITHGTQLLWVLISKWNLPWPSLFSTNICGILFNFAILNHSNFRNCIVFSINVGRDCFLYCAFKCFRLIPPFNNNRWWKWVWFKRIFLSFLGVSKGFHFIRKWNNHDRNRSINTNLMVALTSENEHKSKYMPYFSVLGR